MGFLCKYSASHRKLQSQINGFRGKGGDCIDGEAVDRILCWVGGKEETLFFRSGLTTRHEKNPGVDSISRG